MKASSPLFFLFAGFVSVTSIFSGCTNQAMAYKDSPICKQAKAVCTQYKKAFSQSGGKTGAGIGQLREDCEGAQRACAESVRNLQDAPYVDPRDSHDPWR